MQHRAGRHEIGLAVGVERVTDDVRDSGFPAERRNGARHDLRNEVLEALARNTVGFVKLAPDIHVGGKVAKGSLVATVDVLGVAVEVRADHGGIVAKLRCATGDPVEYGQELFLLESVGEGKL